MRAIISQAPDPQDRRAAGRPPAVEIMQNTPLIADLIYKAKSMN